MAASSKQWAELDKELIEDFEKRASEEMFFELLKIQEQMIFEMTSKIEAPKAPVDESWEHVGYDDLNLEGMQDPFSNSFDKMIKETSQLSEYAVKFDSWTLK